MACAPSEDSHQPGHPPSLIRVFAVRMKKAWVLSYLSSAQRKLWSDWADVQAYLSLRWAHTHLIGFVTRRRTPIKLDINVKILWVTIRRSKVTTEGLKINSTGPSVEKKQNKKNKQTKQNKKKQQQKNKKTGKCFLHLGNLHPGLKCCSIKLWL